MASLEKSHKQPEASREKTPKLLDQVRTVARLKHYSIKTERDYVYVFPSLTRSRDPRCGTELAPGASSEP